MADTSMPRPWECNKDDARRWVAVLTEREGGTHEKVFDKTKPCAKYLNRHHDSVVSYRLYLISGEERIFSKEGQFKPRTKEELVKSRARLRRKRRARQRARKAEEATQARIRLTTEW